MQSVHSLDLLYPNSLIKLANHLSARFHKLKTPEAYPIGKFNKKYHLS